MLNIFLCEHLSHIRLAGGVAYHTRTAAEKRNRLVACHLQTLHKAQRHKVTNVQRIGCRVKADIERSLALIYHLAYFFLVRNLSDKPSFNKFFVKCHFLLPFGLFYYFQDKRLCVRLQYHAVI